MCSLSSRNVQQRLGVERIGCVHAVPWRVLHRSRRADGVPGLPGGNIVTTERGNVHQLRARHVLCAGCTGVVHAVPPGHLQPEPVGPERGELHRVPSRNVRRTQWLVDVPAVPCWLLQQHLRSADLHRLSGRDLPFKQRRKLGCKLHGVSSWNVCRSGWGGCVHALPRGDDRNRRWAGWLRRVCTRDLRSGDVVHKLSVVPAGLVRSSERLRCLRCLPTRNLLADLWKVDLPALRRGYIQSNDYWRYSVPNLFSGDLRACYRFRNLRSLLPWKLRWVRADIVHGLCSWKLQRWQCVGAVHALPRRDVQRHQWGQCISAVRRVSGRYVRGERWPVNVHAVRGRIVQPDGRRHRGVELRAVPGRDVRAECSRDVACRVPAVCCRHLLSR